MAPGETVALHALATRHGRPVEGAHVRWAFDHAEGAGEGVTGLDGQVTFQVRVPGGERMRYVHATATLEGLVAGHDRNVYWVGEAKDAPPTSLHVEAPGPVALRGQARIPMTLRAGDGPTNARVTVTGPCGTLFRAYSGWDGKVEVDFPTPAHPGEYVLLVRATRFPAEPVEEEVRLVVGEGGPPPPCEARRPVLRGVPEAPMRVPGPGLVLLGAALALSARPWARRA